MTDWFQRDEPDPMHAAQRDLRRQLPKRFYAATGVVESDGAFVLALDGRMARTPAKRPFAAPTRALGEAIADEWAAQTTWIDPATMPLTRLANAAIDGVADQAAAVAEEIARYASSDALCYRADEPERLARRQQDQWDPILDWAATRFGGRLRTGAGIAHVAQPAEVIGRIAASLPATRPFELAALHVITTLTGSALLACAVHERVLDARTAWSAAHVDEDFQIELWGEDDEAMARRAARWLEMSAAARLLALCA